MLRSFRSPPLRRRAPRRAIASGNAHVRLVRRAPFAAWRRPASVAFESDRARVRSHLERVERLLRSRDTSSLPEALRAARQRNLDVLRAYRERGELPRNDDFPGRRVPYFIDRGGRACAVAQIVIESGNAALAREVSRIANNAYLPDMRIPALAAWIATSGLTFEELALIQPDYCGGCPAFNSCESATCVPNDPSAMNNHCEYEYDPDGTLCSVGPGELCEGDSVCQNGSCMYVERDCDDGDACTADSCDPEKGCMNEERDCDDGDPCTADSCDPAKGCMNEHVSCDGTSAAGGCSLQGDVRGSGSVMLLLIAAAGIRTAMRARRRATRRLLAESELGRRRLRRQHG